MLVNVFIIWINKVRTIKAQNTIWIIIGAILAVLVLFVVISIFTGKVGKGNKELNDVSNREIGAIANDEYCKSVVLGRICADSCPSGYVEVPKPAGGFKDCKKKCCEKISWFENETYIK